MPKLSIHLFGPFQVLLEDKPVALESDKVRALLAFLVTEPGTQHRREKLAGLLWPGWSESSARNNLRHTLSVLRKDIGDREASQPALCITRQTLQFDASGEAWADVAAFAALRQTAQPPGTEAIQQLEEAAGLYRGDLLQDFSLPDSPEFEEWATLSREQFRRQASGILRTLIEHLSAQGEHERALKHAWRLTELDPWNEEAHVQVMRLLALTGRRSEALAHYETCRRLLLENLGAEPAPETTQRYKQIRDGELGPGRQASQRAELQPKPPAFLESEGVEAETSVFVARDRELARLNGCLDEVLAGQGKVVFVTGEAGSGKSALLQEFAQGAQAAHPSTSSGRGLVVAGGHCSAQTGIGDPYLPFREVLELLTGDVESQLAAGAMTREHALRLWQISPTAVQVLVEAGQGLIDTFVPSAPLLKRVQSFSPSGAEWLPRLVELAGQVPSPVRDEPGIRQGYLFEQYTSLLRALARQAPLLILLDDLQWADLGSISLLFHLGRQLAGSRILIAGAYRPEDVALGRQAPSASSGQVERHPLEPVVQELQRIHGDITIDLGQTEKRSFVEAYLQTEPNRFGADFQEMLYRQTGGHPLFTVELMRGLEEQGALVRDPEGFWIEGPALDWQTLPARVEAVIAGRIDRLPQPLLAALRVASVEGEAFTGEVVARVRRSDEQVLLEALSVELNRRHRLVRARGIQRIEPALSSSKGSQRLSRYRFRHILYQKYLYNSLDEVERAYLHEAVGDTLESLHEGQPESMDAVAGQLAWHYEQAGMLSRAIPYLCQAGERALRLSAHQEAIALLTRGLDHLAALDEAGGGRSLAAPEVRLARNQLELDLHLALGRAQIGDIPEPQWLESYTRARELCEEMGTSSQLCPILVQLSVFHYVRGEHLKAGALAGEALRQAEQDQDPLMVALGHWQLGLVQICLGEYAEAHAQLEHVVSFYEPDQHHQAFIFHRGSDIGQSALAYDACCLWCQGYPDQAWQRSQDSLALSRQFEHPFSLADVLVYAGCMVNTMLRDARRLQESAKEVLRIANEKGFPAWTATATSFLGVALVLQDQPEEGIAHLRQGMALDRAMGTRLCFPTYYSALAEAQMALGRYDEALTTLDETQALVEETQERFWEPDVHRLRAEVLLAQGDEVGAEASFFKAIEIARSQEAKSWELRAATGLARLWGRQGKSDEARDLLAPVYGWFTEGFDTPDLQEARALLELCQWSEHP